MHKLFENIKDFIRFQVFSRIMYGFDRRDAWDVGGATAKFMLPRMRKFIDDEPPGCPSILVVRDSVESKDLAKYFDCKITDELFAHGSDVIENHKAWMKILEVIYFSLEYKANDDELRYDTPFEELRALQDRIDEGFRLLGIFFECLWD